MNHAIRRVLLKQAPQRGRITDVDLLKVVTPISGDLRQEAGFPAYVSLSTLTTSTSVSLSKNLMSAEPMKPDPPVTKSFTMWAAPRREGADYIRSAA